MREQLFLHVKIYFKIYEHYFKTYKKLNYVNIVLNINLNRVNFFNYEKIFLNHINIIANLWIIILYYMLIFPNHMNYYFVPFEHFPKHVKNYFWTMWTMLKPMNILFWTIQIFFLSHEYCFTHWFFQNFITFSHTKYIYIPWLTWKYKEKGKTGIKN